MCRKAFPSVIFFLLLIGTVASKVMSAILPVPQKYTGSIWPHIAKQGTCDSEYVWSVVAPASSDLGATCCPQGYEAGSSVVSGLGLSTVYCCPATNSKSLCPPSHEMLPGLPLCPTPGTLVGVLCQGL